MSESLATAISRLEGNFRLGLISEDEYHGQCFELLMEARNDAALKAEALYVTTEVTNFGALRKILWHATEYAADAEEDAFKFGRNVISVTKTDYGTKVILAERNDTWETTASVDMLIIEKKKSE